MPENHARAGVGGFCALNPATDLPLRGPAGNGRGLLFAGARLPGSTMETSMPAEQSGPRPSPRLRRSPPVVAIVGATGAVGKEFLRVLAERRFPMRELRLYASPRSAGSTLPFDGRELPVAVLDRNSFAGVDLALFS